MIFTSWHKILSYINVVSGITIWGNIWEDINLSCLFLQAYMNSLPWSRKKPNNKQNSMIWILKYKEIYSLVLFRSLSGITQGYLHMYYIVLYFCTCQHYLLTNSLDNSSNTLSDRDQFPPLSPVAWKPWLEKNCLVLFVPK